LLDAVLDHVGRDAWFTAPAAKSHHHHQIRGLAMHSLEVGEIAMAIAQSIPVAEHVDFDALIVGALLHDCGKIEEYSYGRGEPIDISRSGLLQYHTVSGGAMVAVAAASARQRLEDAGVHPLAVTHVMHVIASHHGQKEWGSPVEPRSLEAQIIHIADLASARTRTMLDELESDALQPDGWAIPTAWGRKPVFSLRKALERAGHPTHNRQYDDAAPEATVAGTGCVPEDLPCRTVALLLIRPDLDNTPTSS
jgi:putative nucleotidyltransferase with HDIG domain